MTASMAEQIAALPEDKRAAFFASLSERDAAMMEYDWPGFWARPSQIAPPGKWTTWLLLAGRGFGKTRVGAEWVRERKETVARIALVGPTAADARDVMVEGESGILATSPPWDRPEYEPSKRRLTWPNGATATTYSADEPDRLRGPQHGAAWCDEVGAWRYPETWDMLMFGLRLGQHPQVVATTTPKPVKLVREILADPDTVVTRGSTYENRANLAPSFLRQIVRKYEGSRLGRQELNAELLDDLPGALLPRALIDARRLNALPPGLPDASHPGWSRALAERLGLVRICVGVDPSGAESEDDEKADEIGIVAAGLDRQQRGYLLEDASGVYSPEGWGRKAVEVFDRWGADRIVAERNFGGGMVAATIRAVRNTAPVQVVTASRGKVQRVEPVVALYEQGRIIHAGSFPALEDQLCVAEGTLIETARGQVPVERVTIDDKVLTRNGFAPLKWAGQTGVTSHIIEIATPNSTLKVTRCHPIFLSGRDEFVSARSVCLSDSLLESPNWASTARPSLGAGAGITECQGATSGTRRALSFIARSMKRILALSRTASTSITGMKTLATTCPPISSRSPVPSMSPGTAGSGSTSMRASSSGCAANAAPKPAPSLAPSSQGRGRSVAIAAICAHTGETVRVYNLSVAPGYLPEYFANGILTHNCAFTRGGYQGPGSPDRADAAVWAFSDLLLGDEAPYDLMGAVGS